MSTESLVELLFKETNITDINKILEEIYKKVDDANRIFALENILKYAGVCQYKHMPFTILINLDKYNIVKQNDIEYAGIFQKYITDKPDDIEYPSALPAITCYSKIMGKKSYDFYVETLINENIDNVVKVWIIRELSKLSNNHFDYNIPELQNYDPYNLDSIIKDIKEWKKNGYKDDTCTKLKYSTCVNNPTNEAEKIYAKLYKKISKNNNSLYNNVLIIPEAKKLDALTSKFNLPKAYVDFLAKASPLNVRVSVDESDIELYGVDNLESNQLGYFINEENDEIDGWPNGYVVIADCNSDPYCINTNDPNDKVYFAEHGQGSWHFEVAFESFLDFLNYLSK